MAMFLINNRVIVLIFTSAECRLSKESQFIKNKTLKPKNYGTISLYYPCLHSGHFQIYLVCELRYVYYPDGVLPHKQLI